MKLWKRFTTRVPIRHIARFEGVLGTSLELQILADTLERGRTAECAVLQEIDRLEGIFSAYRTDSELCRWQQSHASPESVSLELATVLQASELWRQRTENAFHPAVEALTRLWREGVERGTAPEADTLRQRVDEMRTPLWEVNVAPATACRWTRLPVTLNAIAKGYILDRACAIAVQQPGVQAALVNIGGDIRHLGVSPVPVHIADPFAAQENAVPISTVRLQNQGVATSGNYRRGFRIGERWHSHLLDPRTGYPVEVVVSASVVAESALLADVLTTAFSVMQPEESLRLADSLPAVATLLVSQSGEVHANTLWREYAA
ncbi:MAG: rane-associated lipoprotein involved in thiamine biosynthesis [Chthonomonadales bacterium]|nr:rane-associated lipoprotein involved in thiamine biosynthesis [Chthonomonadales bacterium]